MPDLFCFLFKYTDEFFTYRFALGLRICDACQFFQESVLRIYAYKIHSEPAFERMLHHVAFPFPEQAVIHKNTDQIVSYSGMEQCGSNRGIDTAGKCQQHLFPCQFTAVLFNQRSSIVFHPVISGTSADSEKEVGEDPLPVFRVRHFRMELYAEQCPLLITHSSDRAFIRISDAAETIRQSTDKVFMTHPANAALRHIPHQSIFRGRYSNGCFPVFTGIPRIGYGAACHERHQLTAIADTEDRHTGIQNRRVIMRGGRIIDTVRSAGENDALIAFLCNFA